ncbi:MAG: hypothetical protein QHH17_03370 [Candidatus Bathyarchaeota archaeon]|jgi:hypothetical protein|nr:hypothetical protein [Candidatus Bathyarchaeota archaeon]
MVEKMAVNDKILKALKNANEYLEKSMTALNNKNDNLFADSIWHFAAELEYALFLFSITLQNENNRAHWKANPKKIDVMPNLGEVQTLLNEAEKFTANGKLLEAYKNVYVARHYTLKIQEDLAKKKREALKKK